MCGIVGIASHTEVAGELYESLIHLQHRGQDAAGILTADRRFYVERGEGLVREIFHRDSLKRLPGFQGIGHTRYPTAGGKSLSDIQPLWLGAPRGIAIAHNGNLTNHLELGDTIRATSYQHFNSTLDSEVLLHVLANELGVTAFPNDSAAFFEVLVAAVQQVFRLAKGSYSVVGLVIGKGLFAFRDPHGIRPLVFGKRERADGRLDYIFASESTSFYALQYQLVGDLLPGELAYVDLEGNLYRKVLTNETFRPCVFEYVYFARPDAILDSVSVYRARLRMGQNLAEAWQARYPHLQPDIVIPTPFTSNTAALSFANTLSVRYSEGLYKNPFIGRTFIMPEQAIRAASVRRKLSPQPTEIANKKVLIVDDSIVRGTTSREIVKMVREVGAKEVYFASSCPPIRYPCFYGIDMPSRKELIAASHTEEEVRAYLGVDALLYQTMDDLVEAITRRGSHHIQKPCMACMDGDYVAGRITYHCQEEVMA